jgi:NitT/TauT family transport system substrate-binding protein
MITLWRPALLHKLGLCILLLGCASLSWADALDTGQMRRKVEEPKPLEYESPGFFSVRVGLQWLPQSQFAGFYMAQEKGFYREAGLDVSLVHTGPGPSSLDYLIQDKVDVVTLFLADALIQDREPRPLMHFGQIVQRPNLMLVAWKDRGIETPADLSGKRVSHWPGVFSVSFRAFFEQMGVSPIIIPQHSSVNLFLRKGVDACAVMSYNELNRIYQAGVDLDQLTQFAMYDYGLGFPEDGLYAYSDYALQHEEALTKLREQTLRGWEYAREHQTETVEVVLKLSHEAGVPANRAHARWMLERLLEAVFFQENGQKPGELGRESFSRTVDALRRAGKLKHEIQYADFTRSPSTSGE